MKSSFKYFTVTFLVGALCIPCFAETKLFDMDEIRDASTLAVEVIKDWHVVEGNPTTRQKCVTIRVGEAWEGQEYRVVSGHPKCTTQERLKVYHPMG